MTIDLAYIDPVDIRALYTHRGIAYWMLEGYRGNKADIIKLLPAAATAGKTAGAKTSVDKSGLKKGDALHDEASTSLGTGNLSGKEWQALVDVIRTTEVLLSGEIPGKAIKKIKASAATNTATEDEDSDDAM